MRRKAPSQRVFPCVANMRAALAAQPVRWEAMMRKPPEAGLKIAGASACRSRALFSQWTWTSPSRKIRVPGSQSQVLLNLSADSALVLVNKLSLGKESWNLEDAANKMMSARTQ